MRQVRSHALARVTSKGQVTIPAEVRKALAIEQGDDLVFDLGPDRTAQLRVIKRKSLSGLYGALPATRAYPGTKETREELGQALGQRAKVQGS